MNLIADDKATPDLELISSPMRPWARRLDIVFWVAVGVTLVLCAVGFVALRFFGWTTILDSGVIYWFGFSTLLGPLIVVGRKPVARFLTMRGVPPTVGAVGTLVTLCGLEELLCYLTGTGMWEPRPKPPFWPYWGIGTLVLLAWGGWTLAMMRLFRLSRRAALYIGAFAGWVQEAILFVPRLFAAPALLIALAPLIMFTYMELMLWPLSLVREQTPSHASPALTLLRYSGALVGILALEMATVAGLYALLAPAGL